MSDDIKCLTHTDENIILIDISAQAARNDRTYCIECLASIKEMITCPIKKIPQKLAEHGQKIANQLEETYKPYTDRIQEIIRSLNIIRDKVIIAFEEMMFSAEEELEEIQKVIKAEQDSYTTLANDLTVEKLQDIGEILSLNDKGKDFPKIQDKSKEIAADLYVNLISMIESLQSDSEQLNDDFSLNQLKLKTKLKMQNSCWALASNGENNLVAGGIENEIVIWEQNEFQLEPYNVLKGHNDKISALVIFFESGDIVSGGSGKDGNMKFWKRNGKEWTCEQTINEHQGSINDLQLSKDQKLLVSASSDKTIKIWEFDDKLQCVQTLKEHTSCVFWVSMSVDSDCLASSSSENYFNVYQRESKENHEWTIWKLFQKIEIQGKIKRVHIADDTQILSQLVNPPEVIVYDLMDNNVYEVKQRIPLNQPDNTDILFPIFQIGNLFYLKNENFIYIIQQFQSGKYYVQQILSDCYFSGCNDASGENVILGSFESEEIQIYSRED